MIVEGLDASDGRAALRSQIVILQTRASRQQDVALKRGWHARMGSKILRGERSLTVEHFGEVVRPV